MKFVNFSALFALTALSFFLTDCDAAVYCPTVITYNCVPSISKDEPADIKSFCTLTSQAPQGWTFYPPAKNMQSSNTFQSVNSSQPMPSILPPGNYTQPAANAIYLSANQAGMCWYISLVNDGRIMAYSALFRQPTTTALMHWIKNKNGSYCEITNESSCAFSA